MSYQSKYTGQEIEALLDRIKSNGIGSIEKLYYGSATSVSQSYSLSDSVDNYDLILIDFGLFSKGEAVWSQQSHLALPDVIKKGNIVHSFYKKYEDAGSFYIRVNFPTDKSFVIDKVSFDASYYAGEQMPGINSVLGIKFGSGDSTPTGNIISFMGTQAPNGYLICDGAELNIVDYPRLAAHFENQFGSKNHFGGDGTTTFAVPDLRNEFLRGYHGDAELQLSGEIGIHQNATQHLYFESSQSPDINYPLGGVIPSNMDGGVLSKVASRGYLRHGGTYDAKNWYSTYTARPTNVAVLYCIKY